MYPAQDTHAVIEFEESLKRYIESLQSGQNQALHFLATERPVQEQNKVVCERFDEAGPKRAKIAEFGTKQNSEISQFVIKPLGIPLSEIPNFLSEIYALLDEPIAKSNNPPTQVFQKTENDYDRHYVAITFEEKIHGIACIGYDQSLLGGHRCYIRHFSTMIADQLEKALSAVVEFVFSNITCDHIRVEINHFKDNSGNLKVDNSVKSAFTTLGFRWKTLNNDPLTGKRSQVMQLDNPKGKIERQEPFMVKTALVLSLNDSFKTVQPADTNCQTISLISLLSLGLSPDQQE